MRSSYILLSIAFILSIQLGSVYTQSSSYIGTWTNPNILYSGNTYCCVPNSITIESYSASTLKATYQFTSYDSKCWFLFTSSSTGTMTLSQGSSGNYYSQQYSMGLNYQAFYFTVNNATTSGLRVNLPYSSSSSSYNWCDFTMNTWNASSGSSNGSVIFIILFFIIVIALISLKNYQKRQQAVIIAQNLAQPVTVPNLVDNFAFPPTQNNVYVAPNMHVAYPNQPTVQVYHQQPTQVIQPNTQMNFAPTQAQVIQPNAQLNFAPSPQVMQPNPQFNVNYNVNMNAGVNDPNRYGAGYHQ